MSGFAQTYEHPLDVLRQLQVWQAEQDCALVVIKETVGGAVRAIGALMVVRADGVSAGYISGGCIDADVVLQAQQALAQNEAEIVRYGAGSPFVDLPLPCGGAIEVLILPSPEKAIVGDLVERLEARSSVTVSYSEDGVRLEHSEQNDALTATYAPKLKVRIAGRGADCLALTKIAHASGFDVQLQLTDQDDLEASERDGLDAVHLVSPTALPALEDDAWTAFVLMFHDGDWEGPLLKQALSGPAFYVGAVGSRSTHARRCEGLKGLGLSDRQVERVHGPIGLVPSLRDASMLALSTLAEIVAAFQGREDRQVQRTGLVLLAAGTSSRFEDGDKLLSLLGDGSVLARTAKLKESAPFGRCLAVIGEAQVTRAEVLHTAGWETVTNPMPDAGQATSLRLAIDAIEADEAIDQVLILLADMPNIQPRHVQEILVAATPDIDAVMSEANNVLLPPALFRREQFEALKRLSGDRGAKSVFETLEQKAVVALSPDAAQDIDTHADLERVREMIDG